MSSVNPWGDFENEELEDNQLSLNDFREIQGNLCCRINRSIVGKVISTVINSGIFGVTAYEIISEALGNRNIVKMTVSALFNGASLSVFGYLFTPKDLQKKVSEILGNISYPLIFSTSQLYLIFTPENLKKLWNLPFIEFLGVLSAKDCLNFFTLQPSDLLEATQAPEPHELLPLIGPSPRNWSSLSQVLLSTELGIGAGAIAVNFIFRNQYPNAGDIGQLGVIQDVVALLSGHALGTLGGKIALNAIEAKEKKYCHVISEATTLMHPVNPPLLLKVMRVTKKIFKIGTPIAISALLIAPTEPNGIPDFFTKAGAGLLATMSMLEGRFNFENPHSYWHLATDLSQSALCKCQCMATKVGRVFKKYCLQSAFIIVLIPYMSWVATTNTLKADGAIILFLFMTLASCIGTDRLLNCYRPRLNAEERNQRIRQSRPLNELSLRLIYCTIWLPFIFQYLTSKISIGKGSLNSDSTALYVLSLLAWGSLGLALGNNLALSTQEHNTSTIPQTPPISLQVLMAPFIGNLRIN